MPAAATEHHWFQLYPWRDRELMRSLMSRAARVGVPTLVVTVDVPAHGGRELELRHPSVSGWILDERGLIRRHINVFVNGERGGEATAVRRGDRVEVLPAITGG